MDIDDDGIIYARYTNGESTTLGKVAMANFQNPQGLRPVGGTSWEEAFTSGTVRYGEAGTSDFGLIQSGALDSFAARRSQLAAVIDAAMEFGQKRRAEREAGQSNLFEDSFGGLPGEAGAGA